MLTLFVGLAVRESRVESHNAGKRTILPITRYS